MNSHPVPHTGASEDASKRPRGILKNAHSYQNQADGHDISPTSPQNNSMDTGPPSPAEAPDRRPSLTHQVSEKELTLQNTLANAGPRRNSRSSLSRRHSSQVMQVDSDESGPRLKWDEANLYLTEQDRGNTMKIDEPKTPYVKQYDPSEDEEELAAIDTTDLVVDELDKAKRGSGSLNRSESIPDLDLGEPEEPVDRDAHVDGEKRVVVDSSMSEGGDGLGPGEELEESMSAEAWRKHREFEERRKRHYEMHNVKEMLSHPESTGEEDEDDGLDRRMPPPPQ